MSCFLQAGTPNLKWIHAAGKLLFAGPGAGFRSDSGAYGRSNASHVSPNAGEETPEPPKITM